MRGRGEAGAAEDGEGGIFAEGVIRKGEAAQDVGSALGGGNLLVMAAGGAEAADDIQGLFSCGGGGSKRMTESEPNFW